jgi:MATE family multidrug resistance protein
MGAVTAMTGFFQGISRPRISMAAALAANALNIGLNWVLIYGKLGFPAMGVRGAALATAIAASFQAVMLIVIFLSPMYARRYRSREAWRLDWRRLTGLFHIGWAAGVNWTLDVLTWGIFMNWFVGRLGKLPLAASNIAGQFLHLSFMPTVGLGIATTALVGQYIGRRDLAAARKRANTALKLGMAYMFMMGLAFFVFRHQLPLLFLKAGTTAEEVANNQQILALCARVLILAAAFQVFDAMAIISTGALKGAGDTRFPMMASVIYGWVVFLPLCWVFTHALGWGVAGAWGGATIYIFAFGLTTLWRWRGKAWETIDIFGKKPFEPATLTEHVTPYEPGEEIAGS